jgi:hypothetical protein
MDFPKIDACIICEAVRAEPQNKNLLLGFFGIAPHVQVLLKDFNLPATLCFVFCGGRGSAGKFDIGLRLTDPQGLVVSNSDTAPEIKGGELGNRTATNIFMGFHGRLGKPGKYTVSLIVNGAEHYTAIVDVLQIPSPQPAVNVLQ